MMFVWMKNHFARLLARLGRPLCAGVHEDLQRMYFDLQDNIERHMMLTAQILLQAQESRPNSGFQDCGFRVFSQFDDDGLIQYLIRTIRPANTTFIEFGVSDYAESNTRFLLLHNNWRGLIMDASEENVRRIEQSRYYWRHDVIAKVAYITAENVNETIASAGFSGEIGLLHIDIDGNDYWVWKALHAVRPDIAIIEYNAVLGTERPIVVPYEPEFQRFRAHFSGLYAGAAILSLCDLAEQKGYGFVGCNSAGNNAYFVRRDRLGPLGTVTPSEGYVASRFRESRDSAFQPTWARGEERLAVIRGLPVYNTRTSAVELI